jgi:hypothetical protein
MRESRVNSAIAKSSVWASSESMVTTMIITKSLLSPYATGPWGQIAKRCKYKYEAQTGKSFDGNLLESVSIDKNGATSARDGVAWGFARKAVRQMQAVCPMCGSPARSRHGQGLGAIRCAACQLPEEFIWELEKLVKENDDVNGEPRTLWAEHELPPLIRIAIPTHVWRQFPVEGAGRLRYVTGEDVRSLMAWLSKLSALLFDESQTRTAQIARLDGSYAT